MPTRPTPATHVPLPLTPEDAPAPRPAPTPRRGPSVPARWLAALACCLVSCVLPACDGQAPQKTCGNGLLDPGEACDPGLPTTPCTTLGFYEGEATCRADCTFDRSTCAGYCGDGVLQTAGAEECDGDDLGEATCQDFGRFFGALRCSSSCRLLAGECRDTLVWGTQNMDISSDIAVDEDGYVYVVGDMAPDMVQVQVGGFLTRIGPDGVTRWTRYFGSEMLDRALAVALGPDGSIHVVGYVSGDFVNPVRGGYDAYLVKFDQSGDLRWARQWGSDGYDRGNDVAVGAAGDVYVTGRTTGTLDGQANAGSADIFLTRFTSDGEMVWLRQFGSDALDGANGVAVDSTGAIYVVGSTQGILDGHEPHGTTGAFILKYSSKGDRLRTTVFGADVSTDALGIAIDDEDQLYVTGYTCEFLYGGQQVDYDDAFLARFDTEGQLVWNREWGGRWGNDLGNAVSLDPTGNPLVAGQFIGSYEDNRSDIFLTRFDRDGVMGETLEWGEPFETNEANSLAVDGQGHVYITGNTASALNGEPPFGEYDAFIIYVP